MKVDITGGVNRLSQAVNALPGVKQAARTESTAADGASMEAFRLLAMNVNILLPSEGKRSVAIMSARPGDGRSFVAANLAIALAEETPTMLVEQIGDDMPLRERLSGRRNAKNATIPDSLRDSVLETDHRNVFLHTLARSAVSGGLSRITDTADDAGFISVVDTPPAQTSSGAFLLAREVGHVIYVARLEPQDMDVHRQIRNQLERLHVKIIGLLINEG